MLTHKRLPIVPILVWPCIRKCFEGIEFAVHSIQEAILVASDCLFEIIDTHVLLFDQKPCSSMGITRAMYWMATKKLAAWVGRTNGPVSPTVVIVAARTPSII